MVGGRNIGDVYFGVRADHNYRDLDVLTTGPIVGEISASFDMFWNNEWAIPVGATVKELPTEKDRKGMLKRLEENVNAAGYPYPIYESSDELAAGWSRFGIILSGHRAAFWSSTRPGSTPKPR